MPRTRVEELETDAEWTAALPILRQLWTDASEEFVRSWADEEGYRLFGLYAERTKATDDRSAGATDDCGGGTTDDRGAGTTDTEDDLVAVAGVSIQRVLHHSRHAWIHDFVVDEAHRGRGFGADLLAFVESWADERDCEYVALAVREGNDDALDFYENEGMDEWGRVVETEL